MNITQKTLQEDLKQRYAKAREEEKERRKKEEEKLRKIKESEMKERAEIAALEKKEREDKEKWISFGSGKYWESTARFYYNERDNVIFIEILDEKGKSSKYNYIFQDNKKWVKTIRPILETLKSYKEKVDGKIDFRAESKISSFFGENPKISPLEYRQVDNRLMYY